MLILNFLRFASLCAKRRIFLLLVALIPFRSALAYDCVPVITDTDIIFKGQVIAIAPSGKPETEAHSGNRLPDKRVTYKVLEAYQTSLPNHMKILYYSRSASDSMPESVGEVRWVYANWDEGKTELSDSSCGAVRSPKELMQ